LPNFPPAAVASATRAKSDTNKKRQKASATDFYPLAEAFFITFFMIFF